MNSQKNIFETLSEQNDQETFALLSESPAQEVPVQGNIFEQMATKHEEKEANKFGFLETAKDIAKQAITKGISGFTGAYGNLLEAFGAQPKEGEVLPGQKVLNDFESSLREKMSKGEPLSFHELMFLGENELPTPNRFPTSKEASKSIENATGIGEGQTPLGRTVGHGAEFLGEGLAYPGSKIKDLVALGSSGLAGQGLREAGAPEALATAVEIGGPLSTSVISGRVAPTSKSAQEVAEAGRALGLTEKQIAPLIQSEGKVSTLSKVSRKGERTKKRFESIKKSLGDSYDEIKSRPEASVVIGNNEQLKLFNKFTDIKNDLLKTLTPSEDRKAAIKFIDEAISSLHNTAMTPEHLVNFWQDINRAVPWNKISGGKKALSRLKEPMMEVLESASPKLAKDFEMTNMLYSKYAQISKKLKPDIIDSIVSKGEILALPATGIALATGNPWPLLALGSESAIRSLATEMLTNPYFQNIANKLVTNFNAGSLKSMETSVKQVREYLERKHPNEDWAFLTED